jgi:hypothetical protein
MNEVIIVKIKMIKIIMTKPTMVKLLTMNKMKLAKKEMFKIIMAKKTITKLTIVLNQL